MMLPTLQTKHLLRKDLQNNDSRTSVVIAPPKRGLYMIQRCSFYYRSPKSWKDWIVITNIPVCLCINYLSLILLEYCIPILERACENGPRRDFNLVFNLRRAGKGKLSTETVIHRGPPALLPSHLSTNNIICLFAYSKTRSRSLQSVSL